MFNKSKQVVESGKNQDNTTLISTGTTIVGDLSFAGTMHIEGSIKGNIDAEEGFLTIAHSGNIEGDIRASRIVIDGHVRGNVYATDHLELASKAVITGNVYYNVIEMTKGSQVNGSLEYHPNGLPDVRPLLEKVQEKSAAGEVIEG